MRPHRSSPREEPAWSLPLRNDFLYSFETVLPQGTFIFSRWPQFNLWPNWRFLLKSTKVQELLDRFGAFLVFFGNRLVD